MRTPFGGFPMAMMDLTKVEKASDYELIEITTEENTQWVRITQIKTIEKLIRFHYDMDINLEGIHAISNLLAKMEELQNEIKKLEKAGTSEDVCKSAEDEVQTLTNAYIKKIDEHLAVKEAEIMKV